MPFFSRSRRQVLLIFAVCIAVLMSIALPAAAFSLHPTIELKGGQRVGNDVWSRNQLKTAAGDMNGNGHNDYLYIDSSGRLWFYPGTSSTTYGPRVQIGHNWDKATALIGGVDFDLDGNPDVLARFSDGRISLYRGTGDGRLHAGTRIGTNWQSMHLLTAIQQGIDGKPSIVAAASDGKLRFYPTDGNGNVGPRSSWKFTGSGWQNVRLLTGTGDLDSNGRSDLVAVMGNGDMRHYSIASDGYTTKVHKLDHDWSNIDWIGGVGANEDGFWAAHHAGALRYYPISSRSTIPNPPTKTSLFVYGTLMKGQPAAHYLNGTYQSYKNGTIANTAMYYSQNRAYPYLVHGMSGTAKGEVYYLKDSTAAATLKKTDAYERYDPSKPDSGQLYVRKMLPISHRHNSWVYIAGPEQAVWLKSSGTRIPSGDWLRR